MAACSVCKSILHRASEHRQVCVICGADEKLIENVDMVDHNYKCANQALHRTIRDGFGQPGLIQKNKTAPATMTELKAKAKGSKA